MRNRDFTAAGKNKSRGTLVFIACVVISVWPADVFAQASTFGAIVCNIGINLRPFSNLFSALAYICAAFLGVKGVLLFRKHAENPNDSKVVAATAHLVGAGTLAALPAAAKVLQQSLGIVTTSTGAKGCTPGAVASGSAGLDVMMQNLVNNIYDPMLVVLQFLCFVIGAFLVYRGLLKGSKIGTDPRAAATHSIVVNLVAGAVLLSIAGMIPVMLSTIFGSEDVKDFSSIINWSKITGGSVDTTKADLTIKAILMFIQIVGAIAFIRGWLIIKNAVEGTSQNTVPQGFTHVIGGTMALNIGQMLVIFDKTFGTELIK